MDKRYTTTKIAINDANLFIDLFEVDLIETFFKLNLELHATSLIIKELDQNQQNNLNQFIIAGKLKIREISIVEIETFNDLPIQTSKLSIQDLSIYFYANELKECMILTGDNKLRKEAEKLGFEVHGILWIFDALINSSLLSNELAILKLEELMKVNLWLPVKECEEVIGEWRKL